MHPDYCDCDLLIVVSGGLSPIAIQQQIPDFLPIFIHLARENKWSIAPIVINARGRVAIGDKLNDHFRAKIVIMLIGERPGVSVSNSLGIYFTYHAKPGCTNENRNCISNIHEHGLSHHQAADKLAHMIRQSLAAKLSGVMLKDDTQEINKLN
jgi:ethanolamine ammonia-lyase small subunit